MFYAGTELDLLLAAVTTMPLSTRDASASDVVATLLFVHGWVPGGWSIAAEAIFYIAFPAILALVSPPRTLVAVTALSYVAAGMTNIALRKLTGGPAGEALAFPFWLVQLPAFVGECWLATLPPAGARARAIAPWMLGLAVAELAIDSQLRGHSNLLVAIALLTAFAWAAGVARPRWLQSRALVFLGRISFSFYIVHFAVLGVLHPLAAPIAPAVAIAGAISACTFRWIEQPVIAATRHSGRGRGRTRESG